MNAKQPIMKNTIYAALLSMALLSGCSKCHVEDIKEHARATWEQAGFEVIGYEGYEYGRIGGTWGGHVWYTVRRRPDNGIIYHGFISKWGSEYHIYNLSAIDAIKPSVE